jgi:hypothetical protein
MRSRLIKFLLMLAIFASPIAHADAVRILVQSSPLAGFKYYAGEALWRELREGDALTLIREPGNTHDANAIRVEWHGQSWAICRARRTKPCPAPWMQASESMRASQNYANIGTLGSVCWSMCFYCCKYPAVNA